ncbi:peptidoglycan DD-metalloendopeptidase family protein [Azospira restricta]|uniref:Peptidoglycan DD-metalloendopeptidase family protein n=1 Tax=Azospira restricta TaxID=404405 RepID=A0A974SSW5_9RHOO|nr:peptidoglycan DD-metalloendopeptidase family protein [Azospira restricta]QRJ65814.1 peptidoglycan DD-metalloendopeptidase family protein [Azospira restricta]
MKHASTITRHLVGLLLALACGAALALPRHLPVPGGIAVLELAGAAAPQVHFDGRPQPVVRENGRWFALIGIPLDSVPGPQQATVDDGGRQRTQAFTVRARHYPTQRLTIPDARMVTPPPELAERIVAEQQRLDALKRHFSPSPAPATDFALPAAGRLSARFGLRRVLNGEARAPHSGLDLAVAGGQPVRAPAAGTVLAVEDFYFAGRTVVIDHGQGLLTLYAHLSQVAVAPGQAVARGAALGASGASGRATGPHLHWVVVVGGSAVDPELFLRRP